jgi:hypothetical protein
VINAGAERSYYDLNSFLLIIRIINKFKWVRKDYLGKKSAKKYFKSI